MTMSHAGGQSNAGIGGGVEGHARSMVEATHHVTGGNALNRASRTLSSWQPPETSSAGVESGPPKPAPRWRPCSSPPNKPGPYEWRNPFRLYTPGWKYWTGEHWLHFHVNKERCHNDDQLSEYQDGEWLDPSAAGDASNEQIIADAYSRVCATGNGAQEEAGNTAPVAVEAGYPLAHPLGLDCRIGCGCATINGCKYCKLQWEGAAEQFSAKSSGAMPRPQSSSHPLGTRALEAEILAMRREWRDWFGAYESPVKHFGSRE